MWSTIRGSLILAVMMVNTVYGVEKYLQFEMAPNEVFPGCTPSMTLRCSVNNTASGNDGFFQKGIAEVSATGIHWTSLVVSQNGQYVASVTYSDSIKSYSPSQVFYNATPNIEVTGTLLMSDAECGFLDMSWADPTMTQNGTYTCLATGHDAMGHLVHYSTEADVLVAVYSETYEINNSPETVETNTYRLDTLLAANEALDGNITSCQQTLADLQQQVDDLTSSATEMASAISMVTPSEWISITSGTYCPPSTALTYPELLALITVGSNIVNVAPPGIDLGFNAISIDPFDGNALMKGKNARKVKNGRQRQEEMNLLSESIDDRVGIYTAPHPDAMSSVPTGPGVVTEVHEPIGNITVAWASGETVNVFVGAGATTQVVFACMAK